MLITNAFSFTGPYAILIMLGVEVLDHLIVAGDKWTSCARR